MRFITIMLFMLSISAQATVTVGAELCPQEFMGKVKRVVKELGPETAFSIQKVDFENKETTRGEVNEQVHVDVLINGPFDVEPGKDYRVQLRNGKLCWIESI